MSNVLKHLKKTKKQKAVDYQKNNGKTSEKTLKYCLTHFTSYSIKGNENVVLKHYSFNTPSTNT